jgi:hypothetical protein
MVSYPIYSREKTNTPKEHMFAFGVFLKIIDLFFAKGYYTVELPHACRQEDRLTQLAEKIVE